MVRHGLRMIKGLTMTKLGRSFRAGLVLGIALWAGYGAPDAAAQTGNRVTLRSFDGFTQLQGELVDFDGTTFTIRTTLGVIQVDALQVECLGTACPKDPMFGAAFAIAGSNTIGGALMPALIQGYADSLDAELLREITTVETENTLRIIHPNGDEMAEIQLSALGNASGFEALASGRAALAMSSRRAGDADVQGFDAAGQEDPRGTEAEQILALDGLIAITHPDNPVAAISVADLAAVFSGRITNWSELGGPDRAISLFARDAGSGTSDTFEELVLAPFGDSMSVAARQIRDNAQLADLVAGNVGGIGIVPLAYARAAKPLAIRLSCGIVARPSTFAVKTEEYPLSRRLYLYRGGGGQAAHALRLAEFAVSEAAQPIIEEQGFVSKTIETRTLDQLGGRVIYTLTSPEPFSLPILRRMLAELRDATRLSINFRFEFGSSNLDPRSAREASELAQKLAEGAFTGKELLLVGFTDSIGEYERNLNLSKSRAWQVFEQMRGSVAEGALDGVKVSVHGYGELTPVRCNDTVQGQEANRRVEVWLRDLAR